MPRCVETKQRSPFSVRTLHLPERRRRIRLERAMWEALDDIDCRRKQSLTDLVVKIDRERDGLSLATAIHVYVVTFYRSSAANLDALLELIDATERLSRL